MFLQSTVGCVVPTTDPNILLAALGSNVVEVDVQNKKTGRIVAFVSTDDNAEGTRFNDGKATPQGVFIVGRMNKAWREGQPGKLFAMDLRVPGNSFGLLTILGPTEVSLTPFSISPAMHYTSPALPGQPYQDPLSSLASGPPNLLLLLLFDTASYTAFCTCDHQACEKCC